MESNIFHDSGNWKQSRRQRIRSFVHLSSLIFIFTAFSWIIISLLAKIWMLSIILLFISIMGFVALKYVRKGKLKQASYTLIGAGGAYFLTICMISGGGPMGNYTTHLWFIVLVLASYFLLADSPRYTREIVPVIFLVLLTLFHLNIIDGYNIIQTPPETLQIVSFIDVVMACLVILLLTRLFVLEITKAESVLIAYSDKLDSIVENILPKSIADRLKKEGRTFADFYPECSVIFADIVSFTPWAANKSPDTVVQRLDEIFSALDIIADKMKITKIKTIGDSYMAASGIPEFRKDHLAVLIAFAEEIHKIGATFPDLQFRIGINSGPVVAGVIGKQRIIYDLWGDTVNLASRLESVAEPGSTLVSESAANLYVPGLQFQSRKTIPIKGKGNCEVYEL